MAIFSNCVCIDKVSSYERQSNLVFKNNFHFLSQQTRINAKDVCLTFESDA